MIITYNMLLNQYADYKAPIHKIARLTNEGKLTKITKGLYETDKDTSGYLLANAIYGPSYLSFEFALSYYGLIPEATYVYTSATFKKKKEKKYINHFGTFTYRDVPEKAFPYEISIFKEGDYIFKMASAEKALCDKLYTLKPVKNKKELIFLLFNELRIDEVGFSHLNTSVLLELCDLYSCTNLKILKKVIRK